jgi:hypothetical protein
VSGHHGARDGAERPCGRRHRQRQNDAPDRPRRHGACRFLSLCPPFGCRSKLRLDRFCANSMLEFVGPALNREQKNRGDGGCSRPGLDQPAGPGARVREPARAQRRVAAGIARRVATMSRNACLAAGAPGARDTPRPAPPHTRLPPPRAACVRACGGAGPRTWLPRMRGGCRARLARYERAGDRARTRDGESATDEGSKCGPDSRAGRRSAARRWPCEGSGDGVQLH